MLEPSMRLSVTPKHNSPLASYTLASESARLQLRLLHTLLTFVQFLSLTLTITAFGGGDGLYNNWSGQVRNPLCSLLLLQLISWEGINVTALWIQPQAKPFDNIQPENDDY
ncbi:hypothetical protein ACTXT7_010780 [Hymenolepis weldensis]